MTPEAARIQALEFLRHVAKTGAPPTTTQKTKGATFSDFIKDHYEPWVTAERKAGKATVANIKAQFGPLFDTKPLTDITVWSVEKFKATRLRGDCEKEIEPVKPATVNRDLDRLRAALNKAVEWGLLSTNPVATVKRSKGGDSERVRFLTVDEEKRLRAALVVREARRRSQRISGNAWAKDRGREIRPEWAVDEFTDHLAPLVLLALNTGLRRGELLGLTWEAVDVERRQIQVTASTAKSGRGRHVPLNAEAFAVVKQLKNDTEKTGLVFPGLNGAQMTHVNRSWAGLVKSAVLIDFHFHDCRHHFASRLVMTGADLYVVKELLGHSDFAMTQRYAHLSPEHKAAAVEKLVAA